MPGSGGGTSTQDRTRNYPAPLRALAVQTPQEFESVINEISEVLESKKEWIVEQVQNGRIAPFVGLRMYAADAHVLTGYDELIAHSSPGPMSALNQEQVGRVLSSNN